MVLICADENLYANRIVDIAIKIQNKYSFFVEIYLPSDL